MSPDYLSMGLGFVAALGVFLVGVHLLSENLKVAAGERLKRLIARGTSNTGFAILSGTVATAALDSSSAVIIIVVGLVHAEAMTFRQALGVVLGANIGTTASSQLYALDVVRYAAWVALPGLALRLLGRSETWRAVGGSLLGLGMVFAALTAFEELAKPLREDESFRGLMAGLTNPLAGVAVGAVVTAALQSSSATVGILIALAGQGAVPGPVAVALMMGAEIGTCLDVLVASAGRSREAVRVGVFQLLFNVTTVLLFVGLAGPLASAAAALSGDPKQQLALAHVLFNVAGVLLFAPFLGPVSGLVERLIPGRAGSAGDANAPERAG